jgi:hypothetical protein
MVSYNRNLNNHAEDTLAAKTDVMGRWGMMYGF